MLFRPHPYATKLLYIKYATKQPTAAFTNILLTQQKIQKCCTVCNYILLRQKLQGYFLKKHIFVILID